jgi:hypothetical protein
VGLILCFPEHDQAVDSDVFPARQALIRLGIRDNYVLLAGGPQAQKFGPADMEPLEKLVAWAKKTYPVNPRRVYMFGKGEGGKISAEFAMTHPGLVTAAITHSWGFWVMPSELTEAIDFQNAAPEIYMNLGHRDLGNHLTTVRDTYPRIKAKGYHVIYREFEDMASRSYYPVMNEDSIAWATRLRNKTIAPSAEEMKLLKAFSGAAPAPVNGYYPTLALVGGSPAGSVLQKLFDSKDANVRAAAAETCSHGIFGDATAAALGKLTSDPSAKVRTAAIHALGMIANWRYQPAQKALIALAMNTSASTNDRVAAIDGLGYAVRLQIRGVRQDPPMFAALVALQSDKDEPVRASASAILAPAFQPTGTTVRPPAGWWQQWLTEITDKEAGYMKDFEVCGGDKASAGAAALFCKAGAEKNPAAAFKLMSQSAEQGYVPAQAHLGMLYANGKGVEQDYRLARQWFVKAGDAGHALAKSSATNGRGGGGPPRTPAAATAPAK